jgi:hypothetical protein
LIISLTLSGGGGASQNYKGEDPKPESKAPASDNIMDIFRYLIDRVFQHAVKYVFALVP